MTMNNNEKLSRAHLDFLNQDNDPSALPPEECKGVYSKCTNKLCVAEPVYLTDNEEEGERNE